MSQKYLIDITIIAIVITLLALIFGGIFVSPDVAVKALEKQGYENIHILEKNWFLVNIRGCDSEDIARFVAEATNPAGKSVEVYVCVGWPFKGATIRTD